MTLASDIDTFCSIESYIKFNAIIRLGDNISTTFIVSDSIKYMECPYISTRTIFINKMRAQLSIINEDGYDKYKFNNNCRIQEMCKAIGEFNKPEFKKQEDYYIERRVPKLCAY